MKKTTNWMLTALLAMGLSMGFIACSDDDDDNSNGGVPTNEAEYKEAGLGWDIITQLTAERTAPESWQNMTFEPTIGKASETDPYTRIVATNDVAAAAERFGGLVGLPDLISETTTSFTYNQEGMGKLTYQMGSVGGQYLAQVDVDLKQVPHLKKILYQTPEQMGNNGYFAGTAYYRFVGRNAAIVVVIIIAAGDESHAQAYGQQGRQHPVCCFIHEYNDLYF